MVKKTKKIKISLLNDSKIKNEKNINFNLDNSEKKSNNINNNINIEKNENINNIKDINESSKIIKANINLIEKEINAFKEHNLYIKQQLEKIYNKNQ